MIQAGKNVTVKDDPLQKIKPEYLYHKLINPDQDISARIRQLRVVRQLDPRQYSQMKRTLPYVVCGIFNPPYRHSDNFAYTEYFIVDIDKIAEKELSVQELRNRIQADPQVLMCFLSPGEDGLKVMFKLSERCYDAGIYSLFYKVFLKQFSAKYQLDQVIDTKTSDAARACFISIDPDAYFNADAIAVDWRSYVNEENTSDLFRLKKELDREEKKQETKEIKEDKTGINDEALLKIKSLLNPKFKIASEKKEAFVPEELNALMDRLIPYLTEAEITITEVLNIQYGKKIRMKVNFKEAEINLFYGKQGYSVVQSPRKGTNDVLNQLCADLINQFLLL